MIRDHYGDDVTKLYVHPKNFMAWSERMLITAEGILPGEYLVYEFKGRVNLACVITPIREIVPND